MPVTLAVDPSLPSVPPRVASVERSTERGVARLHLHTVSIIIYDCDLKDEVLLRWCTACFIAITDTHTSQRDTEHTTCSHNSVQTANAEPTVHTDNIDDGVTRANRARVDDACNGVELTVHNQGSIGGDRER